MGYITKGNASDAKEWVKDFRITGEDKKKLKNFILRFPNLTFYKRQCANSDPKWAKCSQEIFLGVYSGITGYYFSSMNGVEYLDEWECQKQVEKYYNLEDGLPGVPEFPTYCGAFEKITMEHSLLRIIGYQNEDYEYLAVKSGEANDRGVYLFQYSDIWETEESPEEGILDAASMNQVFPSYYEMFNRVTKIRLSNGTIQEAKSVKCN